MTATRLLTLSWDDGFEKSFRTIAAIHDEFGVKAALNIISRASEPGHVPADEWHNAPTAGWDLWNELAARGHEINPHSHTHLNHARAPWDEVKREIDLCLDAFGRSMKGFRPERSVYAMPYNASTPEVEKYLLSRVRALRTGGSGFNPLPARDLRRLTCTAHGPGNCEAHLDGCIAQWLSAPPGWLIYNTHGLDEEGWGPVSADYVRRLYDRLLKVPGVAIVTAAAALAAAEAASNPF